MVIPTHPREGVVRPSIGVYDDSSPRLESHGIPQQRDESRPDYCTSISTRSTSSRPSSAALCGLFRRAKLIVNMIKARPIPAIFLYKQVEGSQFTYNILDGKQRLESLLLFVGNRHKDMKVDHVEQYFFGHPAKGDKNFSVELAEGESITFKKLDDDLVASSASLQSQRLKLI